MFKIIIIDLDGPVLDGMLRHYKCYSDILLGKGYRPMPVDKYWEMKRSRYSHLEQLAVSGAAEISNFFFENWLARIEKRKYLLLDHVQEGIIEKLKQWRARGIKIILATMRNNKVNLYWQLELLGLLTLFDHIIVVGTANEGTNKADMVKPYIKDIDISSILWIGDTEVDIHAAHKLGVKVGAVGCGVRNSDFLLSLNTDFFFPDANSIKFDNSKSQVCSNQ